MNHHFFTMAGTHRQGSEDLNQDFGSTFGLPDGCGCIVADGMGGQRCGWSASRIATSTAVGMLEHCVVPNRDEFYSVAVKASFAAAYNEMVASVRKGEVIEDYGTTFMMAVLTEDGDLHYGFVGDGAMIALFGDGQGAKLVTQPQIGERYARTFGLATHPEHWQFGHLSDVVAVAVATDGVGNCLIGKTAEGELAPNCYAEEILTLPSGCSPEECWGRLDAGLSVVDQTLFGRVTDDRTLAILYRGESSTWPDLTGEPNRKRQSAKAEGKRSRFGWW